MNNACVDGQAPRVDPMCVCVGGGASEYSLEKVIDHLGIFTIRLFRRHIEVAEHNNVKLGPILKS